MPVEVYVCKKFGQRHERAAFGRFLQEMLDRYRETDDLYAVVVEPELNTASMDLIIITNCALIIAELKELTFAEGVDSSEIALTASETNPWEYTPQGLSSYKMGRPSSQRSPYRQIKDHWYKLRDWIIDHPKQFSGKRPSRDEAKRMIYCWDVICPGFNKEASTLDLPWKKINKWYKILSLNELAWEIQLATNPAVLFSDEQIRALAKQMGGVFQENLKGYVPNYVPPAPRVSFFSRPPISKSIIDRQAEKARCREFLETDNTALLCLGGLGGVGKSYLAAWLCAEAKNKGYRPLWIDCGEREVSAEAFFTAISSQMPDRYQAAVLYDTEQKLIDKFDVVIEFLESQKCLVVFDDYHKVANANVRKLEDFLTRALQRSSNSKFLMTTRTRPEYLNRPDLPPEGLVEISLSGFPVMFMSEYIASVFSTSAYSESQVLQIWERTAGNPYAIRLILTILRTYGTNTRLTSLPIFDDNQARQWADSLLQTLSGDIKDLALKLSVVPGSIDRRLIDRIAYTSPEKASLLIRGLIDQYILSEKGQNIYQIQDYMREALYSKLPDKEKKRAHSNAGSYFEDLAKAHDLTNKIESLLQAIYHYDKAEKHDEVLRTVHVILDPLMLQGDFERAFSIASTAARSAKAKNDHEQMVYWLIQQMRCQLDMKVFTDLPPLLNEAFDIVQKYRANKKVQDAELLKWKSLDAQLWVIKARTASLNHDHVVAEECFSKGLILADETGDRKIISNSLLKAAQYERYRGKYAEAKEHLTQAGDLLKKLGDERNLANCLSQLGLIARRLDDLDEAKRLFELAYKKASDIEDLYGADIYLSLIGDIALRRHDYSQAEQIFTSRLERAKKIGNRQAIRIVLGWLFDAKLGINDLPAAEEILQQYEQMCSEANDAIGIAWTFARKGKLEYAHSNIESGNNLIRKGIEKLREIGHIDYIKDLEALLR